MLEEGVALSDSGQSMEHNNGRTAQGRVFAKRNLVCDDLGPVSRRIKTFFSKPTLTVGLVLSDLPCPSGRFRRAHA